MTLAADWATLDWRLAVSIAAIVISGVALLLPYWRRPNLSIAADSERTHSRVEGDRVPYVRLLVKNKKRRRSAKQARVVLDGYRARDSRDPLTSLVSPFLGWPSISGQDSDSYVAVIFAGAERPVGLGRFKRVRVNPDDGLRERGDGYSQSLGVISPGPIRHFPDVSDAPDARWHLHLELADGLELTDERDWLEPGSWTVRLIVGADDGDARAYWVHLAWKGDEPDADSVLTAALDSLKVRRARRG